MVSVNAMKRRMQKNPPEGVGQFLKSLQGQGLNSSQIGKLAQKQNDPEAWKNRFKNIVAENNARGGAAAFGGATPPTPRRGKAGYTDTTPRQGVVDAFSKNNPKSLPNRAANAAGDVGHAVSSVFGGGKTKKVAQGKMGYGTVGSDAIKRRLRNKT